MKAYADVAAIVLLLLLHQMGHSRLIPPLLISRLLPFNVASGVSPQKLIGLEAATFGP